MHVVVLVTRRDFFRLRVHCRFVLLSQVPLEAWKRSFLSLLESEMVHINHKGK